VKGKLQVETSFRTALPSLTDFYARLLNDPPPYVCCLHPLADAARKLLPMLSR